MGMRIGARLTESGATVIRQTVGVDGIDGEARVDGAVMTDELPKKAR